MTETVKWSPIDERTLPFIVAVYKDSETEAIQQMQLRRRRRRVAAEEDGE